ncbi:MAG: hypothetical protein ACI9NQ_001797 [Paracoccaceae bacterium]
MTGGVFRWTFLGMLGVFFLPGVFFYFFFDSLNAALDHHASPPWQALALLTKTAPFQV